MKRIRPGQGEKQGGHHVTTHPTATFLRQQRQQERMRARTQVVSLPHSIPHVAGKGNRPLYWDFCSVPTLRVGGLSVCLSVCLSFLFPFSLFPFSTMTQ